ncbi:MAG: hypothetical protein RBT63_11570, partial [Bdellovibrionales bacterium]|nr:hypothetical protein [Bdellovibrionales bacterium]
GIEDYLHIQIRFRSAQRGKEKPKVFIFFERIEAPSFEMQERILSHLRNKIVRFELLCDVEIES